MASPKIEVDKFYAITLKRSGAATSGIITIATGTDRLDNSRLTIFSNVWVDVSEEDMWFQIWSDSAKVADGKAYDAGIGIQIDKTKIDSASGSTIDNEDRYHEFTSTGENIANTAVIATVLEESIEVQDERTGSPVYDRKKFISSFSFVTNSELSELQETSEPLIIGCMQDTNPKSNDLIEKIQTFIGLAKGDEFRIIAPDADLLSANLMGSQLIPNTSSPDKFKIFKVIKYIDGYGDINGDGVIDSTDVTRLSELVGEDITTASTQQKIIDGDIDTLELLRADLNGDGYISSADLDLITNYVNRSINSFPVGSSFTHLYLQVQQNIGRFDGYYDCDDGYVRLDGYTGQNIVASSSLSASELIYDGYISTPVLETDAVFTTTPFADVTYQIVSQPFWQPYLLAESSDSRKMPVSFTYDEQIVEPSTETSPFTSTDLNDVTPSFDPGRNDHYIPDNLIIDNGEILRPDGTNYKVDLEIGTIIFNLPSGPIEGAGINIINVILSDSGNGLTEYGYNAMRYSDNTTVQSVDLADGKVRFNVSIQSYVVDDPAVQDRIGLYIDQDTGILTVDKRNMLYTAGDTTASCRIQILVYLKKGGWRNSVLEIPVAQVTGLFTVPA